MAEPQTPRQQLIEAIEAYAASKAQDDLCLQRLATIHLATTLKKVDIVSPVPAPQAAAMKAQLPPVPPAPAKEEPKKAPAKKTPAKKPSTRKPRATKKTD